MKAETLTTQDGLTLHTVRWTPTGDPRAVIIIVHGIAEHSARYAHVAEMFTAQGYAVYSLDHRGHGKSQGKRVEFDSFDQPVADLKQYVELVRKYYPDKKLFLYGHSMGSAIATVFLEKHQDLVAGFISSGSPLAVDKTVPMPVLAIGRFMARFVPSLPFMPISAQGLSTDPAIATAYETDPYVSRQPLRLGMVNRLLETGEKARARLGIIQIPVLVLHGGNDTITPPAGSEILYQGVSSRDKTLKVYPGMLHELHNETEKQHVFDDILAWLRTRI